MIPSVHLSSILQQEAYVAGPDIWCAVKRENEYLTQGFITMRDLKTGTLLVLCSSAIGVVSKSHKVGKPLAIKDIPVLGEDEYVRR